jgi:hypothetical protein
MGIIHSFKCQYRMHLIQKAAAMMDRELLSDASQMKINLLTDLHFITEAWRQIRPTTTKKCSKKCGFSSDSEYTGVSNNVLNQQKI